MGVDLSDWLMAGHWDGTPGGKKAHQKLLPGKPLRWDFRHQMAAAKKSRAKVEGDYIAGLVRFSSTTTHPIFRCVWTWTIAQLGVEGKHDTDPTIATEKVEAAV